MSTSGLSTCVTSFFLLGLNNAVSPAPGRRGPTMAAPAAAHPASTAATGNERARTRDRLPIQTCSTCAWVTRNATMTASAQANHAVVMATRWRSAPSADAKTKSTAFGTVVSTRP